MKRKLWILQRPPSTLSCRKIPRFRLFLFPRFLINQTGLQKKIKGGEEKDFTGRDIRRMMRLILEISGAIEGGLLRNLTLVCVQIPEKKKKKNDYIKWNKMFEASRVLKGKVFVLICEMKTCRAWILVGKGGEA